MDIPFTLLNVQWRTIKLNAHQQNTKRTNIQTQIKTMTLSTSLVLLRWLSSTQQNIHYKVPFKLYSLTMMSSFKWNVLDGIDKIHFFFLRHKRMIIKIIGVKFLLIIWQNSVVCLYISEALEMEIYASLWMNMTKKIYEGSSVCFTCIHDKDYLLMSVPCNS